MQNHLVVTHQDQDNGFQPDALEKKAQKLEASLDAESKSFMGLPAKESDPVELFLK